VQFKVTDVGTNRKPVCDFLLVININRHIDTVNKYNASVCHDPDYSIHDVLFFTPNKKLSYCKETM